MTDEEKLTLLDRVEHTAWLYTNDHVWRWNAGGEEHGIQALEVIERCQRIRANLAPPHDPHYLKGHLEAMENPLAVCTLKNCPYHYSNVIGP